LIAQFSGAQRTDFDMPASLTLHPRAVAYALSAVDDGHLAGRGWREVFLELDAILGFAGIAGDLPTPTCDIAPRVFRELWNQRRPADIAPRNPPLQQAELRSFPLPAPDGRDDLCLTVVADVETECVTGLSVYEAGEAEYGAIRALNRAIGQKHARDRRLQGCINAWPCAGTPRAIDVPSELDRPRNPFALHCRDLGIWSFAGGTIDWNPIEATLRSVLHAAQVGCSAEGFAWAAHRFEIAAIDGLNQRRLADGLSPHAKWLIGARSRGQTRT
jgi:hypothetical protein